MTPYYEHAGVTIYHGDCLQILPTLTADLIVTDPPYNARKNYGEGTDDDRPKDEYIEWLVKVIEACETASTGMVLMFLSVNGLLDLTPVRRPRHVCVWDKPLSFTSRQGGSCFLPHWEPCLIFGKTWGDGGPVPSFSLPDVWHHNTARRNGHPCPKPTALMRQIITAVPSKTVLDPFAGSGTTLVAAKNLGRKAIGIEIEERWCELAAMSLSQEVLSLDWD